MSPESLQLKKEFEIQKIASLHYFEYKSDFIFKSEYHDYWKLLYVEDGSAEITFSNKKLSPVILEKGDLFIQSPDEYYSFKAAPGKIAVLFTAGFYCDTQHPALLSNLSNKKFHCQKKEATLLQDLALEGKNNFSPKINPVSPAALERRYNQPFGGEQLISIYLEMLLISLMRQYTSSEEQKDQKKSMDQPEKENNLSPALLKTDSILFNRITDYYEAHITEHIKVEHLCKEFAIGRSHLQRIFREQTGYGAIEYFCQMRIIVAKRCIRENKMNLTDTAAALGYTSIYYFSKQFKKIPGMSPSQYQKMVRSSKKDPIYEQIDLENPLSPSDIKY